MANLRISTVADYNRSEMYNRGISIATGEYVSLLMPGDVFVYEGGLKQIAGLIAEHGGPDLAYSGVLRRDPGGRVETVLRELSEETLRKGRVPSGLVASWYRLDTIRQLGKLDPTLRLRGGFDLICRFLRRKGLQAVCCERVLVEEDRQSATARQTLRRFWETQKVIGHYFGPGAALRYWLGQNHWELVRLWWKSKRFRVWS